MKNFKLKYFILAVLLMMPSLVLAASDMFLKLDGVKGESHIVKCVNGACVVPKLAVGDYTVQVCDARGKVSMQDMNLMYEIVSPRDVATGMPTGKRMHKPLILTMELSREMTPGNVITITDAGSQVAIGTNDANVDASVAKITKSRSNIQNN
jgi:hypothetical protein